MEFLESLAQTEQKQVGIPQLKFYIEKNSYQVAPKHYEKLYWNKNLLSKRLWNPKVSKSQTYPIGAVEFYT